jgi:hypothetical protein
MGGVSLLLIERGPGVKTTQMKCSGVWPSGTTYITYEDVKVPVENLIGKENQGFKYIMYGHTHNKPCDGSDCHGDQRLEPPRSLCLANLFASSLFHIQVQLQPRAMGSVKLRNTSRRCNEPRLCFHPLTLSP